MHGLAMPGGCFEIHFIPLKEPSSSGFEQIEFRVAAHPGATPRPLAKVASGGELARLSLAIAVMTQRIHAVPTLVFDEVDSGIGGAVAEVVGRLLRQLGLAHQVFCVTHLPQVAAQGHQHFQVCKHIVDGKTYSTIELLNTEMRIQEIARMLSGNTSSAITRTHAEELLQLAIASPS
jgi:DNA repair protein RecN (Recombination protein N)